MKPLAFKKYTNKIIISLLFLFKINSAFACSENIRFFASHVENENNGVAIFENDGKYNLVKCTNGQINLIAPYSDFPVGVGYFTDINDIYYTLWMSATSYIYRVFLENKNTPIFDMYTGKAPPTILWCEKERYPLIYIKKQNVLNKYGLYYFDKKRQTYKPMKNKFTFLSTNCFGDIAK